MIKILLSISMLLFAFLSIAQVTLTRENSYPQAGQNYSYLLYDDFSLTPEAGMNQTWDLSSISGDILHVEYTSPEDYDIAEESFPEATIVLSSLEDYFFFVNANSESISLLGHSEEYGTGIYSDPIDIMRFPMSYGDSYDDQGIESITSTILKDAYIVTDQYAEIDAQGTLILPYATIENVIRLKRETTTTQSIYGEVYEYSYTTYEWYDGNTNTFLVRYFQPTIDIENDSFMILAEESYIYSSVETISNATIQLYPNPSSDFFQVSGLTQDSFYEISSINGTISQQGTISNNGQIRIADLASGVYTILLKNTTGIIRKQIVIR